MTSILSNVTHWLGGTRSDSPESVAVTMSADGQIQETPVTTANENAPPEINQTNSDSEAYEQANNPEEKSSLEKDLQEVSEKAMHAAKEWGTYLFSFGKTATEQVVKTAKQFKETVEETTILGDFSKEQERFVSGNREKKKLTEAAVPPWVGYNEEEIMKTQILALSKEKRNFLRNPPAGVQFHFEYECVAPIAQVMLEEDPNLKAMRFELVPKQVNEELFWRNYFYRVSLIKQSTQLTSLAQQTGSTDGLKSVKKDNSSSDLSAAAAERVGVGAAAPDDLIQVGSPGAAGVIDPPEFVSDTFQASGDEIDDAELKKEMSQLRVSGASQEQTNTENDDLPEWEKELQAELQEYEVVDDGTNDLDDADLEEEIMKQIEAEVQQQSS